MAYFDVLLLRLSSSCDLPDNAFLSILTGKFSAMLTHADIDNRIFRMVRLCVQKIDQDNRLLAHVWQNADRIADPRIREEWKSFRNIPWGDLRAKLLAPGPDGDQLRQNAPLGGILSNRERIGFFQPNQGTYQ
jgi:hypothetical protein